MKGCLSEASDDWARAPLERCPNERFRGHYWVPARRFSIYKLDDFPGSWEVTGTYLGGAFTLGRPWWPFSAHTVGGTRISFAPPCAPERCDVARCDMTCCDGLRG